MKYFVITIVVTSTSGILTDANHFRAQSGLVLSLGPSPEELTPERHPPAPATIVPGHTALIHSRAQPSLPNGGTSLVYESEAVTKADVISPRKRDDVARAVTKQRGAAEEEQQTRVERDFRFKHVNAVTSLVCDSF